MVDRKGGGTHGWQEMSVCLEWGEGLEAVALGRTQRQRWGLVVRVPQLEVTNSSCSFKAGLGRVGEPTAGTTS